MAAPVDEDLRSFDHKLGQLRIAYDQYFLGARPREPAMQRQEVQKLVVTLSNQSITNTAQRFKFQSLCSRYQAFKRQWDETLRKIEQGTYERHRFKADLHARRGGPADAPAAPSSSRDEVFDAYVEARRSCGQEVAGLSPQRFATLLQKQETQLRAKFGSEAKFRFRVVVEEGRAKLKAARRK